jgi:hypothetical protein
MMKVTRRRSAAASIFHQAWLDEPLYTHELKVEQQRMASRAFTSRCGGQRKAAMVSMPIPFVSLVALLLLSSTASAWAQQRQGRPQTALCERNDREKEVAHRIMWNQHSRKRQSMQYRIIASEACEAMARRMEESHPDRFSFHSTKWEKFPDGTDNIEIGGFLPHNLLSGEHVLFLASFHNNDVTLSQFQVIICLLQSFIESLTVVLPYYPVGEASVAGRFRLLRRC